MKSFLRKNFLYVTGLVFSLTGILFFPSPTRAGTVFNAPTNILGMAAHWTFDGPDMLTNVRDRSGNGNHGNLTGQTSTTTVVGRLGQALDFDGTDDAVLLTDTGSIAPTSAVTVTAWIKYRNAGLYDLIMGNTDSGASGYRLWYNTNDACGTNNALIFSVGAYCDHEATFAFTPDNKWHFVVGTYEDGILTDAVNIYVDGVLGTPGTQLGAISYGSASAVMGNRAGWAPWDGAIDDVRVYSRVLSAAEVAKLYRDSAGIKQSVTQSVRAAGTGLVGHWTFDGPDMLVNIKDRSGNNNNGYLVGQVSTTTAPGKVGQALRFDGSDDKINLTNPSSYPVTTPWTISAWTNLDEVSSIYGAVWWGEGSNNGPFLGYNGHWLCGFNGGVSIHNGVAESPGRWMLETCTWDGSDLRLYKDGALVAGPTSASPVTSGSPAAYIGNYADFLMKGVLDDVRIYNRALSDSEVRALYGSKVAIRSGASSLLTGIVAYWKMEEASGSREDSAGSNDTTGGVGAPNAAGKIGNAASFDDFFGHSLSRSDTAAVSISGDKTISIWVKFGVDKMATFESIMDKDNEYALWKDNADKLFFRVFDSASGNVDAYDTNTVVANTWYHIIATYTASDKKARMYVDNGSEIISAALTNGPKDSTADLYFGHTLFNYDGLMDEVGIWDRVLTASERTELYNGGAGTQYPF